MIPARYRGRVDLAVNGTYWAGAFLGTLVTLWFLNHPVACLGWRIAYIVGPVLALVIIYVRRDLPESLRWLIMHGRAAEAEAAIAEIDPTWRRPRGTCRRRTRPRNWRSARPSRSATWPCSGCCSGTTRPGQCWASAHDHRVVPVQRDLLHLRPGAPEFFFHVKATDTAYYFMAFAVYLADATIGRLFDTIGRRKMISGTYLISGILLSAGTEVTAVESWRVAIYLARTWRRAGERAD